MGERREGERPFPPSHRPFAFSLYSTVGMGVSLLVRARCACRRLFRTEASLSMLSPRLASAAHPCTRPGCRLQHNRFPGQPCACVACLSASLLAQARGWYVPSGFSDCSAAGSAAPSRQTARCPCTGADRKSQASCACVHVAAPCPRTDGPLFSTAEASWKRRERSRACHRCPPAMPIDSVNTSLRFT